MRINVYLRKISIQNILSFIFTVISCLYISKFDIFFSKCLADRSSNNITTVKDSYNKKVGWNKNWFSVKTAKEYISKTVFTKDMLEQLVANGIITNDQRNDLASGNTLKDDRSLLNFWDEDPNVRVWKFVSAIEDTNTLPVTRKTTAEEAKQATTSSQGYVTVNEVKQTLHRHEFVLSAMKYISQGVSFVASGYGSFKMADYIWKNLASRLGKSPDNEENTLNLYEDKTCCYLPNGIDNLYNTITLNTKNKEYYLHARLNYSDEDENNNNNWKFFHCKLPNLILFADIGIPLYEDSQVLNPLNDIIMGMNLVSKSSNNITQIIVYNNQEMDGFMDCREKVLFPVIALVADDRLKKAMGDNYYWDDYDITITSDPEAINCGNMNIKNNLTFRLKSSIQVLGREMNPEEIIKGKKLNSYTNLSASTLHSQKCLLGEKNQGWYKHNNGVSGKDTYGCISANVYYGESFVVLTKILTKNKNTTYNTYHVFLNENDISRFVNEIDKESLLNGSVPVGFSAKNPNEVNQQIMLRILKSIIEGQQPQNQNTGISTTNINILPQKTQTAPIMQNTYTNPQVNYLNLR